MKFAYRNAKETMAHTTIISFFFNARGEHLEKSVLGMFRSLLVQLLEKLPKLQCVFDLAELTNCDHIQWDLERVKMLFGLAIQNLGQWSLTCFIDALDECEEDQVRDMVQFFEYIGESTAASGIQFHVNSELKAKRTEQIKQIKEQILEKASGIFLWVILVIQILNKEYDRGRIHALRKRLDEIPRGLEELFSDILTRDCENIEELVLCLQWILYANRPLTCKELYFAILSGTEPDAVSAWDPTVVTKQDMERFVLSSSKGLADLTKSENQSIQFIHESVRDFLLSGKGLDTLQSNLSTNFPGRSHERLKQCCQNYIMLDISEHLSLHTHLPAASSGESDSLRRRASREFPFLEYAVYNLFHHADSADRHGIPQNSFIENLVPRNWIKLDNLFAKPRIYRHTIDASLLYILAEKDLPNLIQIELKRVPHMDVPGERYGFPLLAALACKNERAVRALLMVDKSRGRGIYCEEAITCLLKNAPNISSRKHRNVLSWAVKHGHKAVVKLLLETDRVDVDSKDSSGQTLLSLAVRRGHASIAKLLFEIGGLDINSKDDSGRTPLFLAIECGHEGVIKLLLETSQVDIDSKNSFGQTALSLAVSGRQIDLVELLLKTGRVDINSKDFFGRTALSLAISDGQIDIVKLLLETGRINIDAKNLNGQTPLSLAAGHGYETIVKLLLETGQVDINSKDYSSRTPLSWAVEKGHRAVIKLLQEYQQEVH